MNRRRLIEGYYGLTPLFAAGDWIFGANVRAAGLAGWPGLRTAYYALCVGCFLLAHYRPRVAGAVGLAESSANLLILALAVFLPYYALADSVSEAGVGANPFTPAFMANFLLAAGIWCASFYGGSLRY
ncbi:MAG: hypothetical protein JRG76_00010 [Deltaproteobacteria bacterium]|nr:hypothetical protein [Deltaproteobacteria bacterium]MBW2412862.1 hypothetical protein [Deltaproteobacteria bacterium]